MNLGDPELELVDPTPNVHSLFLHFDQLFFWTKLASRAVVRWSKRMYSCAGICSYDRGGLCDIALSEPLLKLRPRKDLIETLLHEMIHAYLFITCRDRDRDGHGPNFKEHMYRINKAAGLNISIYHDFHDEVELYRTHWWRCDGPCQTRKPHFGIVRRTVNRPPGPTDYWWKDHLRKCGGTFVKIKEPENNKPEKKKPSPKPRGDITKYINTNVTKPVLKDSNNIPVKTNKATKGNSNSTTVVTKINNVVFNPKTVKSPVVPVFSGKGHTISGSTNKTLDVVETVRNVWANKQLSPIFTSKTNKPKKMPNNNITLESNTGKHKSDKSHMTSPPAKVKKIDDYFKSKATSILKDLYGKDFEIKETNNNKRLSVVSIEEDLVNCPVCNNKISNNKINRHLDECLNKDAIKSICDSSNNKSEVNINIKIDKIEDNVRTKPITVTNNIKVENVPDISNIKTEPNLIDLTFVNVKSEKDFNINNSSNNETNAFLIPKKEKPEIKIEPSTSKDVITLNEQKCPCCASIISKPMEEHLDECLTFFDNNTTMPIEGASTSYANETIVIDDDDDIFDETLTLNATGTKSPCPCCMKMVEQAEMNDHLDLCLS